MRKKKMRKNESEIIYKIDENGNKKYKLLQNITIEIPNNYNEKVKILFKEFFNIYNKN